MKGKVVLVPFPFDDLSSAKLRPAVCLTDPVGEHRHLVLAFLTSQSPSDPHETDVTIPDDHPGFPQTGLRVSSVLRLHRLITLSTRVIKRELGTLPESIQAEIADKLRELFHL